MICPHCGERFPANWQVDCAPGGQESPGTFLIVGAVVALISAALTAAAWRLDWFPLQVAGPALMLGALFAWSQAPIAWLDCRKSGCPACRRPVRVYLWSR
ncbi:hypothetical protein [Alienimonas californiensis]|uniref:Uncharacterized protein n=1 Tax=Alienimonas californiensis TaxID=2527989 RepID=A0A517PAU5_9PLAN|nr:hypothetical protein [Alienimonas californiensis]QDT16499.1 hypothetical protein CA12_26030 [Alienimonas californiensis]